MATSTKPGGTRSSSRRGSPKSGGAATTRKASSSARKRSGGGAGSSRRAPSTPERTPAASRNGRVTIAKGALGALAGTAALGLAGRAAVKRTRRPRVLGMRVPRALTPGSLDVKKLAKQIGDFAERVEHTSEDVRKASSQVQRVTKELS